MTADNKLRAMLVIYAAGIIAVSVVPSSGGIALFPHADKIGHFIAYTGLGVLACLNFEKGWARLAALLGAVALGASLEFAQQFVPNRSMSATDEVVNALGVLTGALLYRWREDDIRGLVRKFVRA